MNSRTAEKIKLQSFDSLFGEMGEQVKFVPLKELHTFTGHPFKVLDDDKMAETVESIKQYGILNPGIARPRVGGGYELISGHRRKRGCELAGLSEMPVFVRDYSDEEAIIIMVDANIQREDISPGEKARAYRMKFDAMKHQGKSTGKYTFDEIGESAGESGKTVQRYIWLSRLIDELLEMVDNKKLGIVQGVNISFLNEEQQKWVLQIFQESQIQINNEQSEALKIGSKSGRLTLSMVKQILKEKDSFKNKGATVTPKVTIKSNTLAQYFPSSYTEEEMKEVIIKLLEEWKKGKE